MFENCQSYQDQGVVALNYSATKLAMLGYVVCFPSYDAQDYDLVIGPKSGDRFYSVQVKSTRSKQNGNFRVGLRNGTKYSKNGKTRGKGFDDYKVDYLAVVTDDQEFYLIPRKEITTNNSITLAHFANFKY